MKRRTFLQASLATSQLALAIGSGLLVPARVLADWPSVALHSTNLDRAIDALLGARHLNPATRFISRPRILPVGVRSEIPDTVAISILSEKNPYPAVASFKLSPLVQHRSGTHRRGYRLGGINSGLMWNHGGTVARSLATGA
jgi:hypothetical protein